MVRALWSAAVMLEGGVHRIVREIAALKVRAREAQRAHAQAVGQARAVRDTTMHASALNHENAARLLSDVRTLEWQMAEELVADYLTRVFSAVDSWEYDS
jgi:hypothetical protein